MPISLVQHNLGTGSPATTITAAYTSAQTAGNTNIVFVAFLTNTTSITSVTDTSGNTYAPAATLFHEGSISQAIYVADNIAAAGAGSNTVSVLFSQSTTGCGVNVLEWSGLASPSLDVANVGSGITTTITTGSVNTTAPNELLFAAGATLGAYTGVGSGYTLDYIDSQGSIFEHQIVSTTGAYTASAVQGANHAILQLATFKGAPAFAAAGTRLTGAASATANIASPAGVVANDIILVALVVHANGAGPTPAVTVVPTGFTEAPHSPALSTVTSFDTSDLHVYWKRADGSGEPGTYNFTLASAPAFRAGYAMRYTGCITTGNPIDVDVSAGNSTGTLSFPNSSLTTLGNGRLVVWYGGSWDAWVCTQPSGFTIDAQGVTNNTDAGLYLCSKLQPVAGSTGTLTASFPTTGSDAKDVWLGALLPAGGASSTPPVYQPPLRIPNRNVGPMALRYNFRQVLQQYADSVAAVVDTTVTPTAASLTLTGSAPTIVLPQTFTPTGASLTLTGGTPVVVLPQTFTPTGATLTLTGSAPRLDTAVRPAGGSLALTGGTPTIVTPQTFTPTGASLTLTGGTPSVTIGVNVTPTGATLTLTGSTPAVVLPVTPTGATLTLTGGTSRLDLGLRPAGATLTLTGQTPTVVLPVTPSGASLTLTGGTPTITVGVNVTPTAASLTLTGGTPVIVTPQTLTPSGATLTLTGSAPSLDTGLRPSGASLTLTGSAPRLDSGIAPAGGSLTLTGGTPTLVTPQTFIPGGASLALTGGTPDVLVATPDTPPAPLVRIPNRNVGPMALRYLFRQVVQQTPDVPVDISVQPDGATLTLTGAAPTIVTPQTFIPSGATLTLTGSAPVVATGGNQVVTPSAATLTLTGSAPTLVTPQTFTPSGATLTLTGSTPTVVLPRLVTPTAATLTLTGFSPTIGGNQNFAPQAATLTLTGSAPTVLTPRLVTPTAASLTLTGSAPTVLTPQLVTPAAVIVTLTGSAPVVSTPKLVTPSPVTLTLASFAPSVTATANQLVIPADQVLVLTGQSPLVLIPLQIFPQSSTLVLAGAQPNVFLLSVAGPPSADRTFAVGADDRTILPSDQRTFPVGADGRTIQPSDPRTFGVGADDRTM